VRSALTVSFSVLVGAPSRTGERIAGLIAIITLLTFVAVGIDMVIRPSRHMNGYLRRGGEMLRAWNELQIQLAGVLLSCGSGWLLYKLVCGLWLGWSR
jgi:hypothetical protein